MANNQEQLSTIFISFLDPIWIWRIPEEKLTGLPQHLSIPPAFANQLSYPLQRKMSARPNAIVF
jgi:hypothetical protein